MTPEYFLRNALIPALGLLPARMDSPPARAMCIAVCLQESELLHRRQIGGPAHGYGQFEQGGGVRGVLTHPATKPHIRSVLAELDYSAESDAEDCYAAIEHNDILMAAFVRLNLWWLPYTLPSKSDPESGWKQYKEAWKPGKPRPEDWPENYSLAWQTVSP